MLWQELLPILQRSSLQAQDMRQPVVSLRMAHTSILTSPRRSMAACKCSTTSSPSTPEQLNPFVHFTRLAFARPFWAHGKENVNPRGKTSSWSSRSKTKSAKQSAIWSNSPSPVPAKPHPIVKYSWQHWYLFVNLTCHDVLRNGVNFVIHKEFFIRS